MSERTNRKQKKSGKAGGVKLQSRMSRKVLIPVICLVIIAILSSVIGHRNLTSMYQAEQRRLSGTVRTDNSHDTVRRQHEVQCIFNG